MDGIGNKDGAKSKPFKVISIGNCRYCTTRKINDRLVCCCMGQKGMPAVKPDDSCDSWKDLPEDEDE